MKVLSILTILFGFSQCVSTKLVENPPFKIESATYTNWVGGVPGVSGTNVKIVYSSNENIEFDSIYFSKKITNLEQRSYKNKKMVVGNFNTSPPKTDLVMDVNTQKELNNKIPDAKKIPFDLKENEAVVSYKKGTKIKYFKIENLKKGKQVFYQSAPK